jgi:hypothetical protein
LKSEVLAAGKDKVPFSGLGLINETTRNNILAEHDALLLLVIKGETIPLSEEWAISGLGRLPSPVTLEFANVVLDEAQTARNAASGYYKFCEAIPTQHCVMSTATPLYNRVSVLGSYLGFAWKVIRRNTASR